MRSPACQRDADLRLDDGSAVPFSSAVEARSWCLCRDQRGPSGPRVIARLAPVPRPREPADIQRVVLQPHQAGCLKAHHVTVLVWNARTRLPADPDRPAGRSDSPPWQEAIMCLDEEVRACGIVA